MSWSIDKESIPLPMLLASDFDGTLAPIVSDPMAARALPEAIAALWRLSRIPGVNLAVISGRSLEAMATLCQDLPPHWRAGEHGQCLLDPQGTPMGSSQPSDPRLDAAIDGAQKLVKEFCGLGLERKTRSVALHSRNIPEPREAALEAIQNWSNAASTSGLILVPGREVMEAQLPGDGKWQAIEAVTAMVGAHFTIYAGDDVTDMEALSKLGNRENGFAMWVRSAEREPPAFRIDGATDGPRGWANSLELLANLMEKSQ